MWRMKEKNIRQHEKTTFTELLILFLIQKAGLAKIRFIPKNISNVCFIFNTEFNTEKNCEKIYLRNKRVAKYFFYCVFLKELIRLFQVLFKIKVETMLGLPKFKVRATGEYGATWRN